MKSSTRSISHIYSYEKLPAIENWGEKDNGMSLLWIEQVHWWGRLSSSQHLRLKTVKLTEHALLVCSVNLWIITAINIVLMPLYVIMVTMIVARWYIVDESDSGRVAVSAGQFKTGLSYTSSQSLSLSYTDGSPCGSTSYSTTIVFRCRPGMSWCRYV